MPEIKGDYIHIPVHNCKITSTITLSEKDGIKALYCGDDKKIATYLFDKNKWTMEKAKEWIKKHNKEVKNMEDNFEKEDEMDNFEKWWKSYVESENDLDDADFAWLSDEYKKMSKEEKEKSNKAEHRKLPFKVHGKVNEAGWRAAWAAVHGARGGVDFSGGSSKEEVIKILLANKPKGIEIKEEHNEEEIEKQEFKEPVQPDITKIPIISVGKHKASNGKEREFTADDLKRIAEYNNTLYAEGKECPLVVTHCNNSEALKEGLLLGYCKNFNVGEFNGKDVLFADCELIPGKKQYTKDTIRPVSGTLVGDRIYQVAGVGDQAISVANLRHALFNFEEESETFNFKEEDVKEEKEEKVDYENYMKIQREVEELKFELKKAKVQSEINEYQKSGKISPAQRETLESLFLSFNDEQEELMKKFIDLNKMLDFSTNGLTDVLKNKDNKLVLSDLELSAVRGVRVEKGGEKNG